jgi:hypothetical protein
MYTSKVSDQPEPTRSSKHSDKGAAVASPQAKQITRLESLAVNAPAHAAQRKLAEMINGSPQQAAQRQGITQAFGVIQPKTKVLTDLKDREDDKTSNKKISTPNYGDAWYRFARNGNAINSFATNITDQTPKGASPVSATVDIAAKAKSIDNVDPGNIADYNRQTHFKWGDAQNGTNADYRSGKWTWHHKVDAYKMELVDMHAHGGFFHHGGFSKWTDLDSDDSDSI